MNEWNFLKIGEDYPLIEYTSERVNAYLVDCSVFENSTGFHGRVDVNGETVIDKVWSDQSVALKEIKQIVDTNTKGG